jgi:hypothetical protein
LNFLQQAISIKALISFEIRQLVEGWWFFKGVTKCYKRITRRDYKVCIEGKENHSWIGRKKWNAYFRRIPVQRTIQKWVSLDQATHVITFLGLCWQDSISCLKYRSSSASC